MKKKLSIDDSVLCYLTGGQGPLLVMSHALGPLAWGNLDKLKSSCTVAIPDWENSTFSLEQAASYSWLAALKAETGFDRAALCVWSMAGPAAIKFAASSPEHLSHLILVDVAGLGGELPPLRLRDLPHLLITKLRGRPTRGFIRLMWKNWVHQPSLVTKELEEATYRFFRDNPEALQGPDLDDEDEDSIRRGDLLQSIETPTLVMAGRYSNVMGQTIAQATAYALQQAEVIIFEQSSHALQLEEPKKFQDSIAAFVNSKQILNDG